MSGPTPYKPCVFPFHYDGRTFNTCTFHDGIEKKAWCATKVDDSGNVLYGEYDESDHWGNCGSNCPVIEGKTLYLKPVRKV